MSVWLDRDFREIVLGIAVGRRCMAVLACCLLSLLGIPFFLSMDSLPHVRCLLAFLCPYDSLLYVEHVGYCGVYVGLNATATGHY